MRNIRNLDPYSEKQKENWKSSKKIEIYEDDAQVMRFVEYAIDRKNAGKKLYFGIIGDEVAERVRDEVGCDIRKFNCALYSDNVRKIHKDHGTEEIEAKRGQRAIVAQDLVAIPSIIMNAEVVRNGGNYQGNPVVHFVKDGITVVAVAVKGALDLYPQTIYAHKKRSLATTTDELAPVYTSETIRSTASNNSISDIEKNTTTF